MPLYEYRCRTCDDRFELRRPVADADAPATCPAGHGEAVRLFAAFAATGRVLSGRAGAVAGSQDVPMGGPCGGNCACYPD